VVDDDASSKNRTMSSAAMGQLGHVTGSGATGRDEQLAASVWRPAWNAASPASITLAASREFSGGALRSAPIARFHVCGEIVLSRLFAAVGESEPGEYGCRGNRAGSCADD